MSNDTKVTRSKDGSGEKTVLLREIHIPDLWHLAMAIRGNESIMYREEVSDRILEVWHLAHDLKNHIREHCE